MLLPHPAKWTSPSPLPSHRPQKLAIEDAFHWRLESSLRVGRNQLPCWLDLYIYTITHIDYFQQVSQNPTHTEKEALLKKIKVVRNQSFRWKRLMHDNIMY